MSLGYRISRAVLFFIPAVFAFTSQIALGSISIAFAATLLVGAFLTLIYLFIHFDEEINPKIIMEFLTDAFTGIVLITFPSPSGSFSERYFLIMFSVWLFANGMFLVTSGVMDKGNKPWFWFYALIGIIFITIGFIIMNYNPEYLGSVKWLIAFMLIIYSVVELYLLLRRKTDYYPYSEND